MAFSPENPQRSSFWTLPKKQIPRSARDDNQGLLFTERYLLPRHSITS
jgi:hypothetical protein